MNTKNAVVAALKLAATLYGIAATAAFLLVVAAFGFDYFAQIVEACPR